MKRQTQHIVFDLIRAALWSKRPEEQSADADWDEVIDVLYSHALLSVVATPLLSYSDSLGVDRVMFIMHEAASVAQFHFCINDAVIQSFTLLEKGGIRPILLKGQGLAALYPAPRTRPCGDIDIYVGEVHYERAKTLFAQMCTAEELAAAEESEVEHHFSVKHDKNVYELHRMAGLAGNPARAQAFLALQQYWLTPERCERVTLTGSKEVGSKEVLVPSHRFNVWYVFNHLVQHFAEGGVGIRQFIDWAVVLYDAAPDFDGDEEDLETLRSDIEKVGLMRAWQVLGGILVYQLGYPQEHFPFFHERRARLSQGVILQEIIEGGNFQFRSAQVRVTAMPHGVRRVYTAARNAFLRTLPLMAISPLYACKEGWRAFCFGVRGVVARTSFGKTWVHDEPAKTAVAAVVPQTQPVSDVKETSVQRPEAETPKEITSEMTSDTQEEADIPAPEKETRGSRIAHNTFFLFFRMLLMMALGLYTSRVVLRTLGVVDTGIYNVVGGVVGMISFVSNSLVGATQRFINFEQGKKDGSPARVFCQCINTHLFFSLLFVLFLETVGLWFFYHKLVIPPERVTAAFWVYQISIATCVVSLMSMPYTATLIAHEKMSAFAYISFLEAGLKLVVVFIVYCVTYDKLIVYALLWLLSTCVVRMVYNTYCHRHFAETHYHFYFDKQLFKNMLSFMSWNFLGNFSAMLNTQGLNVLLNLFFGPTLNAARYLAVQVMEKVTAFCYNFQMAVNPQITKSYASKDYAYMHRLIFMSSRVSFYLLLLLLMPLIVEMPLILDVWLGHDMVPEHTVSFVRITLLTLLVNVLTDPLQTAAWATGEVRNYQLSLSLVSCLTFPVSYLFLRKGYPPESVFYILFFFETVVQAVRLMLVKRLVHFTLSKYCITVLWPIGKVLLLSLPLFITLTLLSADASLLAVLGWCVTIEIFLVLVLFHAGLQPEERLWVREKITKIFEKKL